ncbi:MAG: regulatory protein RecX [Candidatus Marinimicrobia bacterium]|nr:regulatory protein RecX [Candidatus Neomarinimicrobiota bacterium]MCF7839285.1 regulatory protein RecX [Candidatus Neomarinimicrobiota bacterium]
MSVITKLHTLPKPPYNVELFVDGMLWETVPIEIVTELKLHQDMPLPDALRNEIKYRVRFTEARGIAMRMLAQRERSEGEIRQKLHARQLGEFADAVIQNLQAKDYLNDERFARLFTRDKINLKRWGPQRIRKELYLKGVEKAIIERVLETAFDQTQIQETITALVEKKLRGKSTITDKERQRIWNYLLRQGYASSQIVPVLGKIGRAEE